jgi:N-methylhydantoinase A
LQVESIAICLLFSFVHPEHEQQIVSALSQFRVPLSVSSEILPEYREYERTSTVVINAYLQPLMGRYLQRLASLWATPQTKKNSLRVMQSSGGSISADLAAQEPVRTILSGPSGGVVGAVRSAKASRYANIITFDMGGTSTDVALCNAGSIRTTNEAVVAGLPVAVPVLDIHTVGAGGGSIARVDAGGSLRVGPESAGADPGPACYGKSELPTVTDAHVVLGHFAGSGLLGGEFSLDEKRSVKAIEKLASEVSRVSGRRCSLVAAAEGVLNVVNTNMERALRHISVERGYDPRQFALLPFGGAGGLHAVELARSLRIPTVVLPTSPGALSAIGVLAADVVKDQSRTVMLRCDSGAVKSLPQVFNKMERDARTILRAEGFDLSKQRHERRLGMRYRGQSFELELNYTADDLTERFHEAHRERYGYAQENSEIEIVSARLRSLGLVTALRDQKFSRASVRSAKPDTTTMAYLSGKRVRVGVYRREELPPGTKLRTPCIVTEYSATTLIPDDVTGTLDGVGNLIINLKTSAR